ncbi:hypothetical protein DVH05_008958 [Phytophthora capsici]|nr:hypothetical protein DVH05_008958 [Phytophthora capsici]
MTKAHDNVVFLMSTDGISAAADYYYRRYIDPDNRGLTGDADKWLDGKFTPKTFTDFTDPNGVLQSDGAIQCWIHVGDSFYGKNSKFTRLAKVIFELSLIQTPRRNKLNFDKARRISIVLNKVRQRNREERDGKDETREKKPLDPTERAKVQTPSSAELPTASTAAANEVGGYTGTVEAVDYWLDAIDDMMDEDCAAGEYLNEE